MDVNHDHKMDDAGTWLDHELWGLNPLFRTHVKMYIGDVHQMKPYPSTETNASSDVNSEKDAVVFSYKYHPIYKLDLQGIIVRVENKERFNKYAIDDGTGIINCVHWKQNNLVSNSTFDKLKESLPKDLCARLWDAQTSVAESQDGFALGDLLHVRGRIKIFRDIKEISASFAVKQKDPNSEIVRMLELPKLYREVYDKPFTPPQHIIRQIGNRERMKQVKQLKQEIIKYCKGQNIVDFYIQELEGVTELSLDGSRGHALFADAVKLLEEEGGIYPVMEATHVKKYKVVLMDRSLFTRIMKILKKECSKTKNMEQGCHYLKILDDLRSSLSYAQLTRTALLWCLRTLEEQSEIISTTDKHYIPIET